MRNIVNSMTMKFESRSINEAFARQSVAIFATQLDPNLDEINDIKTAVSEAVTNSIVHAYRERIGYITISAKIFSDNTIEISVKDKGIGISDIEKAREPMFTTGGDERSGMGFTIMDSFMDKLVVKSWENSGTTVTLTKRISPRYTGGK
ncbi:MAG: anti-sigma F factor [Clostridia bacterium]